MRLTAMMNLMLKYVTQQPIDSLVLNAIAPVNADDPIEIGNGQGLNDRNQSPIYFPLRTS